VHCDLKAANVLTTKQSDFGVSFNLRAMEREIKDVTGTPNWMAPESDVVELEGASTMSDIWSLGCMFIELLTGRPPYGNIGNALTGELVGIWFVPRFADTEDNARSDVPDCRRRVSANSGSLFGPAGRVT
jgi:serine/threonine protein kinase